MSEQIKYGGATPGANTDPYTMFDTTVSFSCARLLAMMGMSKLTLVLQNSGAGMLNAYRSSDRGVTWTEVEEVAVAAMPANDANKYEIVIEAFPDFKLTWTNSAAAEQTTWIVDMALVSQRAVA